MQYRNKPALALLLSALLILQLGAGAPALAGDYETHASAAAIQEGVDQGLIDLVDGEFWPDEDISRASWVRLLVRYLGYYRLSSEGFDDVLPEDDAYEAFLIAREAGLASGDEENLVHPDDEISREEALDTVVRALVGPVEAPPLVLIRDADEMESEYNNQVRYAVSKGWFPVDTDNYLDPKRSLTRAQAVDLLDAATGIRIMDADGLGNALDTTLVEQNICVYAADTEIQRVQSTYDLYVMPASGTVLTLTKVELAGTLVVLGAGDLRIELKDSRIGVLETRNPYGTVELIRDSRSSVGNYVQGTPLTLEVQDDRLQENTTRTPPALRWLAIGFVGLLLGLLLYQNRDRTRTLYISQGVGKYVNIAQTAGWKRTGILNPQPQIVDVSERNGKIRIEGLSEGRAHVELYQAKGDTAETQLDGTVHGHLRKSRKGRVFLNIIVVKGKDQ